MKVKLLKDIRMGDKLHVVKRANRKWFAPYVDKGVLVKCKEPQFIHIPFTAGAVVEASDATAEKWIEAGKAEPA